MWSHGEINIAFMECKILLIRSNDQTLPSWTSFVEIFIQWFCIKLWTDLSKYSIWTIYGSNNLGTNMCVVCESNNTRVKLTGDPDHPTTPSPSLKKKPQVPLASPSEKRYIIHIRTYRICKLEGSPFSHNVLSLFGNFFFLHFACQNIGRREDKNSAPSRKNTGPK